MKKFPLTDTLAKLNDLISLHLIELHDSLSIFSSIKKSYNRSLKDLKFNNDNLEDIQKHLNLLDSFIDKMMNQKTEETSEE
jgi:hypothetical protein